MDVFLSLCHIFFSSIFRMFLNDSRHRPPRASPALCPFWAIRQCCCDFVLSESPPSLPSILTETTITGYESSGNAAKNKNTTGLNIQFRSRLYIHKQIGHTVLSHFTMTFQWEEVQYRAQNSLLSERPISIQKDIPCMCYLKWINFHTIRRRRLPGVGSWPKILLKLQGRDGKKTTNMVFVEN